MKKLIMAVQLAGIFLIFKASDGSLKAVMNLDAAEETWMRSNLPASMSIKEVLTANGEAPTLRQVLSIVANAKSLRNDAGTVKKTVNTRQVVETERAAEVTIEQ